MKLNKKKNAIRNGIWGYLSKLSNMFLPFIFRTILIYYLGDKYLGLNSLFTSILQVLNLSELGVGAAIVYSMYKPIASNDKRKINSLLNLYKKTYRIIGLFILVVGGIFTPFITFFIKSGYPSDINIYLVYIGFLINTVISYELFGYRISLLSAFQRNDIESKINLIANLFLYLVSTILIIIFKNYYFYIIVLNLSTILNNVLIYYSTKKYFGDYYCEGKVSLSEKKQIKNNVLAIFCHKIGGTILNSSDNIIISKFLGLTILAVYNNYYYIMNSVSNLIGVLFVGLTGGLGNSFETDSIEKNREYFFKILFFNFYITLICTTCLACLYQDFIKLWLGDKYLLQFSLMLLICIYFYVHTIRRTIIVFRDAAGMWWGNRFQPVVSAILNLILNIILVRYIGLYGIVISTIIAMVIIDIPWETIVFFKNKMKLSSLVYFKKLILYSIILVLNVSIALFISNFLNLGLIVNLFIKLVISFCVSNILVITLFYKTSEFKYFKEMILNFINSKLKKNI